MHNISCIGAIQRHTLALPSTTFQSSWAEGSPGPLASRVGAYWSVAQERKSFTARKVILGTESWVGFRCGHLILEMCWESCPIGYKQQVCWQRLSQGWEPAAHLPVALRKNTSQTTSPGADAGHQTSIASMMLIIHPPIS